MEEIYPHEGEIEPELLLGVDLTEYFGGTDLASAERVVVSQLKYSHRHPNLNWTAARLAESKGGRVTHQRRPPRCRHPRQRPDPEALGASFPLTQPSAMEAEPETSGSLWLEDVGVKTSARSRGVAARRLQLFMPEEWSARPDEREPRSINRGSDSW